MKMSNASVQATKLILAIAAFLLALGNIARAVPTPPAGKSYTIEISGTKEWVDTNIDLRGGAKVRITATGQITYPADTSYTGKMHTAGTFGPDGLERGFADLLHQYAVTSAGHGALIGRVGSADYAQAFLVGASKEYEVPVAGR
ncbi:MAG: hypothetical protein WAN03_13190, partial [Candidatus Sulfotelmatobacter sp.]